MKKTIVFALLLGFSTAAWAQNATIKGKFTRMLPNKQNVSQIYLFKAEDGHVVPVSTIALAKNDQSFTTEISGKDLNSIRYIGLEDEMYPVYMRKDEAISIEAENGKAGYSGKMNAENTVFAGWYKMMAPLRMYAYTFEGRKLAGDHYAGTLDSLTGPAEKFIRDIKTGNASFDRYVKYMLPYSFKFDALGPFLQGLGYRTQDQYPPYMVKLFNTENYADRDIWTLPFGYQYIQSLGFVKHIVYKSKMGYAEDMILPEISNADLRAEYVLKALSRNEFQNMASYTKKNSQYMTTDLQKKRMKIFETRGNLRETGGAWIDFAYPDVNGKVRHLSDFLGKVVLIDVWATWCPPCIAEQPALEALEKSFEGKDVAFISVSIDTDKAKWQNMVSQKKLSGLHLFTNNEGSILQDYAISEVPRFILFDKEGKTVMFDALRPSDPKLKELIQSKL